jgi:hypothetical protein
MSVHVAVVIPAFNIAAFLADAIVSLLDQTYRDWSLVVVDDGSTDATAVVAARFKDSRIRLIRQPNSGVSAARNAGVAAVLSRNGRACASSACKGLGQSTLPVANIAWPDSAVGVPRGQAQIATIAAVMPAGGEAGASPDVAARSPRAVLDRETGASPEAVLFLDGDDWLAPDAVATLVGTLEDAPWAVAAVGRFAQVGLDGTARLAPRPPQGGLLERLLTRNLFANGGHLLIRRQAIQAAGAFRVDLSYGEDWEYWTRLALEGEFVAVSSDSALLFVRERLGGAYLARAIDPQAYRPALDVIYHNPGLVKRVGPARLSAFGGRAEAEVAWTVGRELIRRGRLRDGLSWLGRSVCEAPSPKRLAMVGLSWLRLGPFRPYRTAT